MKCSQCGDEYPGEPLSCEGCGALFGSVDDETPSDGELAQDIYERAEADHLGSERDARSMPVLNQSDVLGPDILPAAGQVAPPHSVTEPSSGDAGE